MTIDDISDRKQGQEALIKSEQHLRSILDNLVAMVGVLTPDGIVIEANRTALKAADLKLEDVKGKPFEECYWWSWSTEVQKSLRKAIQRAAGGKSSCYNEVIRVGEGKFRTIEFMLYPVFDPDGHVSYLIPSANDITERKRAEEALRDSEEKFRTVLKNSNFITSQFDRKLRYRWIYNPHPDYNHKDIIGKRDDELKDSQSSKCLMALKQKVIETGKGVVQEIGFPLAWVSDV